MSETTTAADGSVETEEASVDGGPDEIERLAERGQRTLARLVELPGGTRALGAVNDLRNRVDELGKKVRGLDALEQRIAALEVEVAGLKGAQAADEPEG